MILAVLADPSVAVFELDVPSAQRLAAPAHSHDHYDETIYGLEGVLTWTVDGKRIEEVINAAAGGPPDRAKMAEIMMRHGLTPAAPRPSEARRVRCRRAVGASILADIASRPCRIRFGITSVVVASEAI